MHAIRIALTLALGTVLSGLPVAGQEPRAGHRTGTLEALNAAYHQQLRALEGRWIADLAALAEKSTDPEADAAYRQLFHLAIARDLCSEAQAAAQRYRASRASSQEIQALAALVQVLARAEKGEHDRSLADLKALFTQPGKGDPTATQLDAETALAVGEAYLQRLLRDGRYDVARKLCDLVCQGDAPAVVKDHFEDRMARLALVGKPAPPIAGSDVDGKPVSLAELKGKVVLVDFWATWCPPCVASIPVLSALDRKYHDRGFVILGVNLDAMHQNVQETRKALPLVRRFLVDHRVTWTNILNSQGTADFAAAYGVEQIPANFLVGRDGTVVAVEQSGDALERAVVTALGSPAEKPSR